MREIPLNTIELPNGMLLCSGTKRMVPGTSPHTRVVEMRLPPMQLDPVATFTIVAAEGVGTMFGIYSLKFNHVNNQGETQVAVNAQNVEIGKGSDFNFFCSYVVVGKRLDSK